MLFSSINRFSSHQFHSSPLIGSALLVDGFGRSKRGKCRVEIGEHINAVKTVKVYNRYGEKTVNGYGFKNVGTP